MKRGDGVTPGLGKDIRTYSVDQLKDRAREVGDPGGQLSGEIERRARAFDDQDEDR